MFLRRNIPRRTSAGMGEAALPCSMRGAALRAGLTRLPRATFVGFGTRTARARYGADKEGRDFDFSFITKPPTVRSTSRITASTCRGDGHRDERARTSARSGCCCPARGRGATLRRFLGVTIDQLIEQKYGRIRSVVDSTRRRRKPAKSARNGAKMRYTNSDLVSSPKQPLPTQAETRGWCSSGCSGDGTSRRNG